MKLSDARLAELEALAAVLAKWNVDELSVEDDGERLVWADPEEEGNPYEVASSTYFGVDAPDSGPFLGTALEAMQALPVLLAEVRSSRAALARIERAWDDPGAVPSYHERMKRIVQHQWPVLAHAIRRATT